MGEEEVVDQCCHHHHHRHHHHHLIVALKPLHILISISLPSFTFLRFASIESSSRCCHLNAFHINLNLASFAHCYFNDLKINLFSAKKKKKKKKKSTLVDTTA